MAQKCGCGWVGASSSGGDGDGVHMDGWHRWDADGCEVGASGAGIHSMSVSRVGRHVCCCATGGQRMWYG